MAGTSAGNTQTSIDALLKEYYDDGALVNETFKKNPLWGLITKSQAVANVTGRRFIHPVVYGGSQGRSRSFSRAQARGEATGELSVDFVVPRVFNHQVCTVDNETILSTKDDRGAFTKAVTLITDNAVRNLGLVQAQSMYSNQSESRGVIAASGISGKVITLATADDALKFEIGMELDLAAAESTGAVEAYGSAGHGLYVAKVDYNAGTITMVSNVTDATDGIPTAADGMYIFVRGDRNSGLAGLQAWLPYGGPQSGDSFLGVDRTVQPVRLAGNWMDGTQMSVEEALITAATQVEKVSNGSLTHFFIPYNKYKQLLLSKEAKRVVQEEVNPQVSFEGLEVLTTAGTIMVHPDRNCPANRMFGLNIDTWEFIHLGDTVQIDNLDGNTWLRQTGNNGQEIRFFSLGNVVCRAPAENIVISCQA